MKKHVKTIAALAGAVGIGLGALYAAGFRLHHDPVAGRVHLLRKVAYAGGQPTASASPSSGLLAKIEILTPDPVILENMEQDVLIGRIDAVVKAAEISLAGVDRDMKLTLTVVFHPDRETDNIVEAAKGDEEAAARFAEAVDQADKDVRTRVGDVSVRLHFDTARRPPGGAKKSVVFVPGAETGPGNAVPGEQDEKDALAAAVALSRPPSKEGHRWEVVVCNPSFWRRLKALDASLAAKGTATKALRAALELEARTFSNKPDGVESLYRSAGFQKLMGGFAAGKARAATQAERAAIYAMIPFEISGLPATVLEASGDVLYVSTAKDLLWLDVISDYDKSGALIGPASDTGAATPPAEDPADPPEFLSACPNEIGLFCQNAGEEPKALEACLRRNRANLLPACAKSLR